MASVEPVEPQSMDRGDSMLGKFEGLYVTQTRKGCGEECLVL